MANPIQIVLNADHYQTARDVPSGGGRAKEFYPNADADFVKHRDALRDQAASIAGSLRAQSSSPLGHLKVKLRRGGWAKSHRPFRALFQSAQWNIVGGGALGELYLQATPEALTALAARISQAESDTRWVEDKITGKIVPNPSRLRSETGAVASMELYAAEDRRNFSRAEALAWLTNSKTGGSYIVDLFAEIPPEQSWDAYSIEWQSAFRSFRDGLRSLGSGIRTASIPTGGKSVAFLVRLEKSNVPALVTQGTGLARRDDDLPPFDASPKRHDALLQFLDRHPLVRRIRLPSVLAKSARSAAATVARRAPASLAQPVRDTTRAYPKVGVIDGGVSDVLAPWIIARHGFLADEDKNTEHGTFIGGLLVTGNVLNGSGVSADLDGVDVFDLDIFPDQDKAGAFEDYYPNGLADFINELEVAVATARASHGVRVFNISLNVEEPVPEDTYSQFASRLDAIAEAHNVIFVVSAGNLATFRGEWPADTAGALAALAASRNDGIFIPAESVRNISVASLNPPGLSTCIHDAPSRFSRRGPGLRAGAKPDVAHVGGSGSACPALQHGLHSIDPSGAIVSQMGTSYSAPWVAKCLAHLDAAIEGDVSRETLHALLVHASRTPDLFKDKALAPFARDLVGFGKPPAAHHILERGDDEATIVIATRLMPDQQIAFSFAWPRSLCTPDNKCRGAAKLSIVASTPIDVRFGAEMMRINIDAALQQSKLDGGWQGRAAPVYLPRVPDGHAAEADLVEHGLKWNPVKRYEMNSPRGVGETTTWRVLVKYITRSGVEVPAEGIPFTAILTISDPKGEAPVFRELQQSLTNSGVQISDIRNAVRIKSRV